MHRYILVLSFITVTLLALNAGGARAQETTPVADPIKMVELAPGIAAEVFAAVSSARAPGQTVYLSRLTFQPGAEIFPHSHPGTSVIGVVSGSFGWKLLEGSAQIVRGAAAGATAPRKQ